MPDIDNRTIAATGMGKTEILALADAVALRYVRASYGSSFYEELAHYRLEESAPQRSDDDIVEHWFDLNERSAVQTLDDSRSAAFFRLPDQYGSSASRRFEALSAVPQQIHTSYSSSFYEELAYYRLEESAPQWYDDYFVQHWLNLAKRSTLQTFFDPGFMVSFRLLSQEDGSSASRRFAPLSAAEAWQDLLQRMVVWARRIAPWRLWHYLLIALTRRSNAISWSDSPPGQSATSSRRAPRGPNRTQMTTDPVICGESLSYAYS